MIRWIFFKLIFLFRRRTCGYDFRPESRVQQVFNFGFQYNCYVFFANKKINTLLILIDIRAFSKPNVICKVKPQMCRIVQILGLPT